MHCSEERKTGKMEKNSFQLFLLIFSIIMVLFPSRVGVDLPVILFFVDKEVRKGARWLVKIGRGGVITE